MGENLGSRVDKACPVGDRVRAWLDFVRTTVAGCRTAVVELIADHATTKVAVDEGKVAIDDLVARQAENLTAIEELIDDHATFKTVVDEVVGWAETLGAKLNADTGVNDEDYDDAIAADTPDTLTAGDPTGITATSPSAGPGTLDAGDPDAPPAALGSFE